MLLTSADPANVLRNAYTPSIDGQRFLLMSPVVPCGEVVAASAAIFRLERRSVSPRAGG